MLHFCVCCLRDCQQRRCAQCGDNNISSRTDMNLLSASITNYTRQKSYYAQEDYEIVGGSENPEYKLPGSYPHLSPPIRPCSCICHTNASKCDSGCCGNEC